MTRLLVALLSVTPLGAVAAAPEEAGEAALHFGDWLAERGDYYRAIGEFERAIYLTGDHAMEERATLRIGRAYGRGGQIEQATLLLRPLSERGQTPAVREGALFELGYARLLAHQWDLAATTLHRYANLEAPAAGPGTALAKLLEGLALVRAGDHDVQAARVFEEASESDAATRAVGLDLAAEALALSSVPSKSALAAGLLSAAVPGLGHLYVGQPGMAAAAFVLNATFIWASVESFRQGRPGAGTVFLVGESIWYGGAIFGAVAEAHRYNRDARVVRLEQIEERHRWLLELRAAPGEVGLRFRTHLD